jgi:hypothetical protein
MTTPDWAMELTEQVAATHKIVVPHLSWKQSGEDESSGVYYRKRLAATITAGTNPEEARMVVLHEMAHHLAHVLGRAEKGHGDAFYFICWALYLAYDVPLDLAVANEFQYKAAAERVLRKMGVALNAHARKAGDYGDARRTLKVLQGQVRKWQKRVTQGGANVSFYRQREAQAREQALKAAQTCEQLRSEWKASGV